MPSQWASSGPKELPVGWEGSGGLPAGPGGLGRPSQKAGSGPKALPIGQARLGNPP